MKIIANRYEMVKTRVGGMGVVYLCLDRQDDRPVALKTFRPEYLSDRAARDRFLREGTIWIELGRHPHVVGAHRFVHIDDGRGEVYLVLEWVAEVEGKKDASLRQWLIQGKPLPTEQALLFALHIARGMKHVTTMRSDLVHRDLKPENVLVWPNERAQVTDFGLARTLAGGEEGLPPTVKAERTGEWRPLTQLGCTPGTPEYMAPEQWIPGAIVDARADIYAFGCILYEMFTGLPCYRVPWRTRDERLERYRHCHVQEAPPRVRDLVPMLPEPVEVLVHGCLKKHPEARPTTWGEVETAVAQTYESVVGRAASAQEQIAPESRAERVAAGNSYHAMGSSYCDIAKYDVAVAYFERAIQIGKVEHEQRLEGAALGNLGIAYNAMGMPSRAIGYYEQSLAISREIRDRRLEGRVLGNLGISYMDLRKPQQAIGYYEQSLAIAREIRDRTPEGRAIANLGNVYKYLGKPQQAIGYYEQSLAIALEIGSSMMAAGTSLSLAQALGMLGRPAEALRHAEYAMQLYTQIGCHQDAQQAQRVIALLLDWMRNRTL